MAILDLMPTPSDSRKRRTDALPAFVSRQVVTSHRYFLDLRPIASRPLTVVCGGEELVRRDYRVERDEFPYFCIEFVAAGEGSAVLAGRTVQLGPGSVFTYGPGVPHTIQTDPRRRLRKYYIDFIGTDSLKRLRATRLTHERLQVRQAAARLGFADPYQFSRAFKRVAGVSPRDFRNRP
jgi:hypothetical protein